MELQDIGRSDSLRHEFVMLNLMCSTPFRGLGTFVNEETSFLFIKKKIVSVNNYEVIAQKV